MQYPESTLGRSEMGSKLEIDDQGRIIRTNESADEDSGNYGSSGGGGSRGGSSGSGCLTVIVIAVLCYFLAKVMGWL